MATFPSAPVTGTAVPGADAVVAWLGELASPDLTDAERIDRLRLLEELKSRACAVQARLAVDLDESQRAAHAAAGLPAARQGRGVAAQLGLARRESPHRAASLLGLAKVLIGEMTCTYDALACGRLSEYRATLLARETACLSLEDRHEVDRLLCADPARFEGWGDQRLAAEARRLAQRLDPHACAQRASRAEADRHVSLRPAPDTMSRLSALLPVAQGIAVWATLSRVADSLISAGDGRSRGQIMADTLVERVTGQATADAVPVAVNLTIPDETLLAGGHEPAWVQGHGPIPAQSARQLTATALAKAHATLRRLYTTSTGQLAAMDSHARRFPDSLSLFIDLRDQTCRTPWCDAPVRHHDHPTPRHAGGATTGPNSQGLCEQCNYAKEAPGWRARPTTGPPDQPHTIEITTPTGHRHHSTAPPLPTPTRPRPTPHRVDLGFRELHLAA
jgi:hypothetical protein